MDKMILGLLLLKELTIYEIKNAIQTYLSDMSSSSMGAIQAAIKKLLANDMIGYNECVSNGVNKKIYHITEKGNECFLEWLSTPMSIKKAKNIELSKMYFMGLVMDEKRTDLIQAYIDEQKIKLKGLHEIRNTSSNLDKQVDAFMESNRDKPKHLERLRSCTGKQTNEECIRDIAAFSLATLDYGIQSTEFEITWYENLKEKLEKGD